MTFNCDPGCNMGEHSSAVLKFLYCVAPGVCMLILWSWNITPDHKPIMQGIHNSGTSDHVHLATNICIGQCKTVYPWENVFVSNLLRNYLYRRAIGGSVTGWGWNDYASVSEWILFILLHEMSIVRRLIFGDLLSRSEKDYRVVVQRRWRDTYDLNIPVGC